MTLRSSLPVVLAFSLAGAAALGAAAYSVAEIERRAVTDVDTALEEAGFGWAEATSDGLQLTLTGTAPDEATRFRALSVAGSVVDPSHVIDRMSVTEAQKIDAPHFSIEVLRNDHGVSVIGLVPEGADRDGLIGRISAAVGGAEVTDLLESADYAVPEGWYDAVAFGMDALERLPHSKVSIAADGVSVTAIAESRSERQALETELSRAAPDDVPLHLSLSAPRPVITPFTLRFLIDGKGPRFDACSAGTEKGRTRILGAAEAAGVDGTIECTLGVGRPSPDWADAAAKGIAALAELGAGSLTFSDADISLVAEPQVKPERFEQVVGDLRAALPEPFTLDAEHLQPVAESPEAPPPQFLATRSPEGQVQLRGDVRDERASGTVESFAKARFGIDTVSNALSPRSELPDRWSPRLLAALDTLSLLHHGAVSVDTDTVSISGTTGVKDAKAKIAQLMSDRLGNGTDYEIEVSYEEALDKELGKPTPEECVAQINNVLDVRKITFAPGSDQIDGEARESLDRIADLLKSCDEAEMEIGGHTDSQGRESMNQELSQSRAEAVRAALMARRVLVENITAKGYGETQPIADNSTEEGREANRRIEFTLLSGGEKDGTETAATEDGPAAEAKEEKAGSEDAGAAGDTGEPDETAAKDDAEEAE